MKIIFNLSILTLILIGKCCLAQNNFGPRLTAMGNNGAAVNDIWSIEANPAGITKLAKPTLAANYARLLADSDLSRQAVAFVLPLKNNFIGFGFNRYGIAQYNEIKAGLAMAKKFGNDLSISVKGNYHQISITNYGSTAGFSVDVGAMYKLNDLLTFGFYINNPSMQAYSTKVIETSIPTVFHLGSSYQFSDKLLLASTISKAIKGKADFNLGLDYKVIEMISLRAGLSVKPFKHYAGFGFNYRNLMIDFAVEDDPNISYTPQIALAYAF
jgi:long-subunit fatty acid transport protein